MHTYSMKSGDTKPMRARLTYSDGSPVDLTGATVSFYMGTTLVDRPATVVDATDGVVEYPWGAGETNTPGQYPAEFKVTVAGASQRVPSKGTIIVKIDQAV